MFPRILLIGVLLGLALSMVVQAATTITRDPQSARGHFETALASMKEGDSQKAIAHWLSAADLFRAEQNTARQIDSLLGAGESYRALGRHQNAVDVLNRAYALAEASNDTLRMASIHGSTGESLAAAGLHGQAVKRLTASVAFARKAGHRNVAATSLNSLGNAHAAMQESKLALQDYLGSNTLARELANHPLAAISATNAARTALDLGQADRAIELVNVALRSIGRWEDSHDKAFAMLAIGQVARDLGRLDKRYRTDTEFYTWQYYQRALEIGEALQDERAISYAHGYLGQLYEYEARYQEALQHTRQATFSAQAAGDDYGNYQWEWQAGRLHRKQGDIDEAIAAYRRALYHLQSIRHLLTGEASSREQIAPVYFELADLLLQRPATLEDDSRVQDYLLEARATVEQLKAVELQDYFQDGCVTELQSRITPVDNLGAGTAAVYPVLLPDRLELLLSLPSGLKQITVQVPSDELTEAVRAFRTTLEKRTTHQYIPHAKRLYEWLIRPLEPELQSRDIKTLVIIPDGSLRTIPLSALHDGEQFLIERYAVATTPGLALTDLQHTSRNNVNVLLNGLTESVQGFPALPHVKGELAGINDLYKGKLLQDRQFQSTTVRDELTDKAYSIVHIATHGEFSSDPKGSFLLTFDDRLTMDRLEDAMGLTQFRDQPVDLLTLSACQTAAGDDRAALGLAGIAVKAGARSALATLWFINDEASSLLVTDFYRRLQNPQLTKAQALQQAQVELLQDGRYRHPGYWAPFLLIGNWL